MTKQEQIEEIAVIGCVRNPQAHTAEECSKCVFKQGMCSAYRHAEALVQAGYGDVSEYKSEREMLGSQIKALKQRLNNKYVEIEQLKSEFKQLETNAEILAWGVRDLNHENYELTKKVKQAKIDVLNKAKERLNSAPNGWAYTTYIDELIEEVENEQKD